MNERNKVKLQHSKENGEIHLVLGDSRKYIPYFWIGSNSNYLGVLDSRRKVQKLKRLCEEYLERTEKN